jgi:cation:H+ antiporter
MNAYLTLLIGVACAGVGGELFVRGLIGLARWARISAAIVGISVAAFATSSPELSVGIGAALAGRPEVSLGDALGSNVVNVALILGLALCISSVFSPQASVRRDFSSALALPVLVGILGFDGMLSRPDGILLLIGFAAWFSAVIRAARRERRAAPTALEPLPWGKAGLQSVAGLLLLLAGGRFIVTGARSIAEAFGIPEFIIGATVVAVGTSVPELATTLVSKLRGHEEIGLATVLGSNLFNGLFIVGLVAVLCPIHVAPRETGVTLGLGLVTTLFALPLRDGLIPRWRGAVLMTLYALYLVMLLRPNGIHFGDSPPVNFP